MTNSNWLVTVANSNRKALISYGVDSKEVAAMDLKEVAKALKDRGYNFKANSPVRNR